MNHHRVLGAEDRDGARNSSNSRASGTPETWRGGNAGFTNGPIRLNSVRVASVRRSGARRAIAG